MGGSSESEELSSMSNDPNADDPPVLVNKALSFMWASMQKEPHEDVAIKASRHFTPEDVVKAKKALWKHCRDDQALIGHSTKRKNTNERSGALANARDIVHALEKLDLKKKSPRILIDAIDVASLPQWEARRPPSTSSEPDMLRRLEALESVCRGLQDTLFEVNRNVKEIKEKSIEPWVDGTYADEAWAHAPAANQDPWHYMPWNVPPPGKQTDPEQSNKLLMSEVVNQLKGTDGIIDPNKKYRTRNAASKRGKAASEELKGSSLKSGRTTFEVQLTNVHPSENEASMKKFVEDQDIGSEFSVEDTSSEGWETKRFKVRFKQEVFDKVMEADFWPKGIYFRQFFPPRRQRQGPGRLS